MYLDWSIIPKNFDFFMEGAGWTLAISALSIAIGFMLGVVLGMGRISKNRVVYSLATVYVEAFRGTPLLIQIFIIYLGLPSIGIDLGMLVSGVLALSLNSAAYQAEIFRGGVQSIPKGQMEASRSLGMSYWQSLRSVIIPQSLRNALPSYTNEFITLIKDSSLVSTIGILELTKRGSIVISSTFQPFVVFMFVAAVYFTLTFSTSHILRFVERKTAIPGMIGGD